MEIQFEELEGLEVKVEQVVFVPDISDPPLRPFGFVYFISIYNGSAQDVRLLARKWIIKEESGETTVVEGEGIVGEKPFIEAGDSFSYNSCHVVGHDAIAYGAFYGIVENSKKRIMVSIPEFSLRIP